METTMAKQIIKRAVRSKVAKAAGKGKAKVARVSRRYAADMRIKVLAKANPFRASCSRHKSFAGLRNGMLVSAAVPKVLNRGRLGVFVRKGLVAVN